MGGGTAKCGMWGNVDTMTGRAMEISDGIRRGKMDTCGCSMHTGGEMERRAGLDYNNGDDSNRNGVPIMLRGDQNKGVLRINDRIMLVQLMRLQQMRQ